MPYTYTTFLSANEVKAIRFLADRYGYAEIIRDALDSDTGEVVLSEADAWELKESVESGEDGGFLPCAGGDLRDKIEGLLLSIV